MPCQSQGWDAVVDDRSVDDKEQTTISQSSTQTLQQQADTWLWGMATAGEEVQELVIQDLIGRIFRTPEPIGLGEGSP